MLTDNDRGKLYKLVWDYNRDDADKESLADKTQIVNSWKNEFMRDPAMLDKISVLQSDGTRKPKSMKEIREHIPDETVTNEIWSYDDSEDVL